MNKTKETTGKTSVLTMSLLMCLLVITDTVCAQEAEKTEFPIQCGVNISHWLSGNDTRGEERRKSFAAWEVKQLRDWGFDFLRIPVEEVQMFTEDGAIDEEAMKLVESVLKWCQKYGMRVLLDLHIIRSHEYIPGYRPLFQSEADQQHLCDMWTLLATRLKDYPEDFLAFELLNEPAADSNLQWNLVAGKVIRTLRAINSKRVLVVSANRWAEVDQVSGIRVPANDPNIMLTFHFYEPPLFTHYRAAWREELKNVIVPGGLSYPGQLFTDEVYNSLSPGLQDTLSAYRGNIYNKEWMRSRWDEAVNFAREKGRTLLLGEFGCLPAIEQESRINWVNDVVDLCNELGLPRSYWEYKSAFGFCNWYTGLLENEELMQALVRKGTGTGINSFPTIPWKKGIYDLGGHLIANSKMSQRGIYLVHQKEGTKQSFRKIARIP